MPRLSLPALAAAAFLALVPAFGSALANPCAQLAQIAEQDQDEAPAEEVADAE
jgi:hypothetical protein